MLIVHRCGPTPPPVRFPGVRVISAADADAACAAWNVVRADDPPRDRFLPCPLAMLATGLVRLDVAAGVPGRDPGRPAVRGGAAQRAAGQRAGAAHPAVDAVDLAGSARSACWSTCCSWCCAIRWVSAGLQRGFLDGPAQLLSFALPLVSPLSLLVWPVTLCWLAGLIAGESLARSRLTLLPYAGWLVVFAVGYAGSSRAMGADAAAARRVDVLVGAALLLVLILLRVAQGWLQQEESSEAAELTGSDEQNLLPLQRILSGLGTAVLVVAVVGYLAGTSVFAGAPTQLKRVPAVIQADPTTPLAYVASLRPALPTDRGSALFQVSVDRQVPGYFPIASVDYYDGDSWSFTRDFRPSGGVVPADTDPDLAPVGAPVTQQYRILSPLLARTPWMPAIFRPQKVMGLAVSVDAVSGMIVPTGQLSVGQDYQVRSAAGSRTLRDLPGSWLPATSAPPVDSELPPEVRSTLASVVAGFATETGHTASTPTSFLQAVAADLRANYLLAQPNPSPGMKAQPSVTKAVPTKGGVPKTGTTRAAPAKPAIPAPTKPAKPVPTKPAAGAKPGKGTKSGTAPKPGQIEACRSSDAVADCQRGNRCRRYQFRCGARGSPRPATQRHAGAVRHALRAARPGPRHPRPGRQRLPDRRYRAPRRCR